MFGESGGTGLAESGSSIGNSHANGVGPMSDRPRFFNPYPFDKYAIAGH